MEELSFENHSNTSGSNSICYEETGYCVESTVYRKVLGTVIFVAVWPFIVLDIKKFPLGRPAAALVGATLMVIFVVVPQEQVYLVLGEKGNLQTLFLLIGMMLLSYYYDREGMLNYVALYIFGKGKPFKHVLWKVCALSAVLSAIITNDATCVVLTPILLAKHMEQGRSKIEYAPLLLGIATSANIGSASTFFGNPQNAFIAANSDGQVSLLIFFITTLPAAVMGTVISVLILYLCYFRTVWPRREEQEEVTPTEQGVVNGAVIVPTLNTPPESPAAAHPIRQSNGGVATITTEALPVTLPDTPVNPTPTSLGEELVHVSLANSRRESALSYDQSIDPYESSQIAEEFNELYVSMQGIANENITSSNTVVGTISSSPDQQNNHLTKPVPINSSLKAADRAAMDVENQKPPKSQWRKRVFVTWLIVVTAIMIILLAVPPPPVVSAEFNLGLIPVGAAVLTMLVDTLLNKKYAFDAMIKVDWTMILMFMGLFVWLTGFQNTLFPSIALDFVRMYMDLNTVHGVLFFAVFVAVGSNILSNVPLVILIVRQLSMFQCGDSVCTAQLTGVLLAWVSTIAGNFTLIGSVANLIVAEKARNVAGYRLSLLVYLKFGFCSTIIVLFAGLPIVYFTGDNAPN